MRSNLNPKERKYLDLASPIGIQKSAPSLLSYFSNSRWLDNSNTYSLDPIKSIKNDINSNDIKSQDMREYVAVSTILHLIDSWEYLGKALYAQVSGAPIAIHLGYYAEMRATMSLLATQGIGIFNQLHIVIDKNGKAYPISRNGVMRRSTHEAVWLYLEHWLKSRDAGTLLGTIIRPRSVPLTEWINKMPCTNEQEWVPSASSVLYDFGLDLKRMTHDRDLRNVASYRPFGLSSYRELSPFEQVEFLFEIIRILEPSTGRGDFDILDQYFLCQTIEKAFTLYTPQNKLKQVTDMLDSVLGDSYVYKEELKQFIIDTTVYGKIPNLIKLASDKNDLKDSRPLLSRAGFLLYIATSAVRDFMRATNIDFEILNFWWSGRGWELGLWKDVNEPLPITDLWADVAVALEEIDDWLNSDNLSAHSFYSQCAQPLHETTNLGRFAIIGLAS